MFYWYAPKKEEEKESDEKYVTRSFIISTFHEIS
jgi:hypothetical protein